MHAMNAERSPRRYFIELILFCSYAAFSVSWMAISPLAPALMQWFHVTKAEFALLNTVVTASKVVAPVLSGMAVLRFGVKNTILLGSVFIAFALLGPIFPDFSVFLFSRALFGVGGAVLVTLAPAMVMQWFPDSELPIVNGLNGVAANTGFALALSLTLPLSQTALGWRGTLLLFSLVSIALLAAWALVAREGRSRPGGASASEESYFSVWKRRETWLVTMAFTGPVAIYLCFALWLPTYYKEQFHFSMLEASRTTSIILYTGIPAAITFGFVSRAAGLRRPFLIWGGLLSSTAALGTFLLPSSPLIVCSAVLFGIGLFVPTSSLTTLIMELPGATPRRVALTSGTMISTCYLVNSFLPNLIGWASDRLGSFVPGFLFLVVLNLGVSLAGLLLPETGPAKR
jgi:cyanate permease